MAELFPIKTYTVNGLNGIIDICTELRRQQYWSFRGQRRKQWKIQPHHDITQEDLTNSFKSFNDRIKEFPKSDYLDEENLWRWLFYAQHYGLKTPLLDWTSNPLVAAYFAVENIVSHANEEEDLGCVWAITVSKKKFKWADEIHRQPFKRKPNDKTPIVDEWLMIKPPPITPRIVRQSGIFTYHPNKESTINFEANNEERQLVKINIEKKNGINPSKFIRQQLGIMNLHHAHLFPDPGGVAKFVNYELPDLKPGKIGL